MAKVAKVADETVEIRIGETVTLSTPATAESKAAQEAYASQPSSSFWNPPHLEFHPVPPRDIQQFLEAVRDEFGKDYEPEIKFSASGMTASRNRVQK